MLGRIKRWIISIRNNARGFLVLKQVGSHKGEIYVGGRTRLSKQTHLGRNPNFNGMTINGIGKVLIGDNFHSGTDCLIITSYHNYDYGKKIPYDDTYLIKDVFIGDNVWFGDKVLILGGIEIGEGAIVQAGAVVSKSIPAGGIAGGNPAQVFKYRNMDHYYDLKEKEQFH
ncbi:acyltransferase [Pedobacter frigoris]|uniref:Acyltransferase n=1 Tax=Pedobacter frigoris TaxID=2571272 RepID=A0A4V5NYS6_9SPHI|nr:acyltransferase [Pedobacter frigoris]TKC05269.1 acyltransferase [Pedobacter frigoris]